MFTIFNVLIKPRKTFDYLYDQFDHTLNNRNNYIFLLSGFAWEIKSLFTETTLRELDLSYKFMSVIISLLVGFAGYKYLISPIIFFIGKMLKGQGELIDIQVVIAYSLLPKIFTIPLVLYLGINDLYGKLDGAELLAVNAINLIAWALSINILIQGLFQYNKYGWAKSVINSSLIWIVGLLILLYQMSYFFS